MTKWLEKFPFYPFLVGIYPILFLVAVNVREVSPIVGVRSALIFLALSLLAFLAGLATTRDPRKAALAALFLLLTFFLVFFKLYAPVYRALRESSLFGLELGRHRVLVPATLLLLIAVLLLVTLLLRKAQTKLLATLALAGNLVSLLLVLFPLLSMGGYALTRAREEGNNRAALPQVEQPLQTGPVQPDIYYIILDMHTNDNVVSNVLDFKLSGFTQELEQLGFFVAPCSQSNYPGTQRSITSSLNMDYLQALTDSTDTTELYPLLMNNRVQRALVDAGYRIYNFESGYKFTNLAHADTFLAPVSSTLDWLTYPGITPFESLIMQVSAGQILYEYRAQLSQRMQYLIDAPFVQYRERILYTLETLPTLAAEPGPKFVFAHILAPHDPFVFNEDGSTIVRRTPFNMTNDQEYKGGGFEKAYVGELRYLDQRVLAIVRELIANSSTPPVIILQGDHGLPRLATINAEFSILNAYYLGGEGDAGLSNTISPVNSFRVVFNHFFGTSYPLLEDLSYEFNKQTKEYRLLTEPFSCQ